MFVPIYQASRPTSLPPNTRDTLYHALPNNIKSALPSQLQTIAIMKEVCPPFLAYHGFSSPFYGVFFFLWIGFTCFMKIEFYFIVDYTK